MYLVFTNLKYKILKKSMYLMQNTKYSQKSIQIRNTKYKNVFTYIF